MLSRRSLLALALSTPVLTITRRPAFASEPEVFAIGGLAIRGYDPVAYFTQEAPVEGSGQLELMWHGAVWRFVSPGNMARFEANPEAFAPKYGGYCAYAVSQGATATTEPDAWTIYEERLYLNYNQNVREIWSRDIPGNIAKADENWPGVLG